MQNDKALQILREHPMPKTEIKIFDHYKDAKYRIGMLNSDEREHRIMVGAQLEKIELMIGVKDVPKTVKDDVLQFVFRNYKDFHVQELHLAFDLALAGRYKVNTNHFNSFNSKYVAMVLNAYREYRQDIIKRMTPLLDAPIERKFSDAEKLQINNAMVENIVSDYERILNGEEIRYKWAASYYYEFLQKIGIDSVPREIKNEMMIKAKDKYISEYKPGQYDQPVSKLIKAFAEGVLPESHKANVVTRARALAYEYTLNEFRNQEYKPKDLHEFITEKLNGED